MKSFSNMCVIPSYFGVTAMGAHVPVNTYNTPQMMLGEVKEAILPNDDRSKYRHGIEYSVMVEYRDSAGAPVGMPFNNCRLISAFGGVADRSYHTLRADIKEDGESVFQTGSKVLVICLNGDTTSAYIIGGIREDSEVDSKEDGHNLFWEFNGLRATVNKDGELQVKFRGATKVDGKLADSADPAAEGSTATFTKDGGIALETVGGQNIFLDHLNKKLFITADAEWNVTVNGSLVFNVQQDMTLNSTVGGCSIGVLKNVNVQSAGVHVGLATDQWMKGTTYRLAETTLHSTMLAQLTAIAALVSTAAATLQATSAIHKIPVVGPIIGSAPLQAAATALNSAGPMFGAIAGAISAFEGGTGTYLSIKNLTD